MAENVELQNMRLTIMNEVNEKFNEVNAQFDALIEELNRDGTEFSRALQKDIENMRKNIQKEMKEVWSYLKSKLVSIEAGQKMLYDPKDGIMTKVLNKADAAVTMARDSALCTANSKKAAENSETSAKEAKVYVRTNIFVTALTFLGILITVVTFGVTYTGKLTSDAENQKKMIKALNAKLVQDAANQKETVDMMEKLYKKLQEGGP